MNGAVPVFPFPATAWTNGARSRTGAGYDLRISAEDRGKHFERRWNTVTLRMIGERTTRVAEPNVDKTSFWDGTCRELINAEIGQWFIENGFDRWTHGIPPRFRMRALAQREFDVRPDHRQ